MSSSPGNMNVPIALMDVAHCLVVCSVEVKSFSRITTKIEYYLMEQIDVVDSVL